MCHGRLNSTEYNLIQFDLYTNQPCDTVNKLYNLKRLTLSNGYMKLLTVLIYHCKSQYLMSVWHRKG